MSASISATELAEMEVDAAQGDLKAFDSIRLLAEVRRLREWRAKLLEFAALQAMDEALWAHAEHISEAYIQQELRRLTAAVEVEP